MVKLDLHLVQQRPAEHEQMAGSLGATPGQGWRFGRRRYRRRTPPPCSATSARSQRGGTSPVGPFRYIRRVSVLLGYARVSTAEHNAYRQTDELTPAGCYEVFVDHASGVLDRRGRRFACLPASAGSAVGAGQ